MLSMNKDSHNTPNGHYQFIPTAVLLATQRCGNVPLLLSPGHQFYRSIVSAVEESHYVQVILTDSRVGDHPVMISCRSLRTGNGELNTVVLVPHESPTSVNYR